MSIYSIDFPTFVRDYLPPNKREPRQIAWLSAVLVPLGQLHLDTFVTFRNYIIDRAKQNGQRIVMENILNTFFAVPGPQFILIDNSGDDRKGDLFFNQAEALPAKIYFNQAEGQPADFIINESEVTNNRNFVVLVPTAVFASVGETALRAEIDRLKPYGTFYTITQY